MSPFDHNDADSFIKKLANAGWITGGLGTETDVRVVFSEKGSLHMRALVKYFKLNAPAVLGLPGDAPKIDPISVCQGAIISVGFDLKLQTPQEALLFIGLVVRFHEENN